MSCQIRGVCQWWRSPSSTDSSSASYLVSVTQLSYVLILHGQWPADTCRPLLDCSVVVWEVPFLAWNWPTAVRERPTKLSSPPPSRSIAPICIPEVGAGAVAGGVRSRLSRSPRRSPWDGMTAGGASETPVVEPVSGLSTLSPLNKTESH